MIEKCAKCGHDKLVTVAGNCPVCDSSILVPIIFIDQVRALVDDAPIDGEAKRVMVSNDKLSAVRDSLDKLEAGE
jgi:hypothetical protein